MNLHFILRPFGGLTAILSVLFIVCCNNYYKIAKIPAGPAATDSTIQANLKRYFILRSGNRALYMSRVEMSGDRKSLSCMLDTLPPEHRLHLRRGRRGQMRYEKLKPESVVLNEVHFYTPEDPAAQAGNTYTLNLEKIEKLEVLIRNRGRSTRSYIMGGVGITLGIVAVVGILAATTKSSCPFVSANDGHGLILQGEIYGGAIYPQLARNDYLQLNMAPLPNGNLQVRISNELSERQYTDIAELIQVTHRKDQQIRVDENGRLYSIADPQPPLTASVGGRDISALLKKTDDQQVYAFNDTLREASRGVELCFKKNAGHKNAKLILKLKNAYWLDLIYGKMTEGFGAYYTKFIEEQHSRPAAELHKWAKEQELAMSISLKTNAGWKPVADITTFGPLANRETVVPLNLDSVGEDQIRIRLSCGFLFWELDYAALDCSAGSDYTVTVLPPEKAMDEAGRDVTRQISSADGFYLEQPVPGNATDIEYVFTPNRDSSKTQSFFLHAKGYYEHVRHFRGAPNAVFLRQFTKPGALGQYSLSLYQAVMRQDVQSLADANSLSLQLADINQ